MYDVKVETLGYVAKEQVSTITMPRADFLPLVVKAIELVANYDGTDKTDELLEKLMPVAKTMPRFPMGTWIAERGCGCLVGEFLVAREAVEEHLEEQAARLSLLGMIDERAENGYADRGEEEFEEITDRLYRLEPEYAEELIAIGNRIDTLVRDHLNSEVDRETYLEWFQGPEERAVIFVD